LISLSVFCGPSEARHKIDNYKAIANACMTNMIRTFLLLAGLTGLPSAACQFQVAELKT